MKKLFAVILLSGIVSFSFAQVKLGVKGGISTAAFKKESKEILFQGEDATLETLGESKVGYHGGLMLRLKIFNVYLQPEAYFSTISNELQLIQNVGDVSAVIKQEYKRIDIPVNIGMKFGPARVQAGPVASFYLSEDSGLEDFNIDSDVNKTTMGFQIGAGLDLLKVLTFDVRYEGSLSKLGKSVTLDGREFDFDQRSSQFLFSVGFFF